MRIILCSACLLDIPCRYDGKVAGRLTPRPGTVFMPICPEQLAGLPTPREPAEQQPDGRVLTRSGRDVTEQFRRGAEEVLRIARETGASMAILKQRSPSCGSGRVYDGTFSGKVVEGDGVTTTLLKQNGLHVVSEEDV